MGCSLLVSMASPVCLVLLPGKPSKTMVDCLATFVEEMQFQIKLILKIPRGHETLHNLVDEALLLKEARSWSHANLPYANVFGSFKIRPCCIDQIKQVS
ncbi:Os02g0435100 [Oryza sativa Japonica Group]|uniref:Os02g0435100 protein n=1 Tax=Oryza sativa subsp. japonica TaxID=39947 RepID=A0A0P0VII6_ORYSJ|nr:Os02g0435100 [Oryza sativa Japonica Group]